MRKYFQHIAADVPAAIVLFLIALPLCLGIALGSDAPNLFTGIIGGVVGALVIGMLSGSQLSVSAPAAGLTVIVASALHQLPAYEAFLLAVVLAGVFQLILGFLRVGFLADFVPNSVIKGMLAGIGFIIILKQLPHFVGFDKDFTGDEAFFQRDTNNTFSELLYSLNYITPVAILIGVMGILIQVVWDKVLIKKSKVFQLFPAALVVVVMGILLNIAFGNHDSLALGDGHLVNIPIAGSFSEFTSFFASPDWSFINNYDVWSVAVTLALVASSETLLSIEAADKLDPSNLPTDTNRELKAHGIANIISGLIGGLPMTAVVIRSSANISAGAKTKLSVILHGILLLLAAAGIPSLLNKIPFAALASVLIYTGYKLARISLFREVYKQGWSQFIPFVATIVAMLLSDLLTGTIIGIVVGLYFMVRNNFKSSLSIIKDGNFYLFRFRKDVSFLNKALVKRKLEQLPVNAHLLIDTTRAEFIDKDVIDTINEFSNHAGRKNILVEIKKSLHNPMHDSIRGNIPLDELMESIVK